MHPATTFAALVLLTGTQAASLLPRDQCPDVDAGYNVDLVLARATQLASRSWEFGTCAEALLELKDPNFSVFSPQAFPHNALPAPSAQIASLRYAKPHISTNSTTLVDGDGAAGDPASLGVSAILIGRSDLAYDQAAQRQKTHLLQQVPRFPNGAISQRDSNVEAWADFMFMAPPFLAYAAVRDNNVTLLRETVHQSGLYRDILQNKANATGYWRHIVPGADGTNKDLGLWSTGNAWAAMGMARALATLVHWRSASSLGAERDQLVCWIQEILDGAMTAGREPGSRLLRNYLPDSSWFGETSGTALLAATAYRMAVLAPDHFGAKYVKWADDSRAAVSHHINSNGTLAPAVNPLGWTDRKPYTAGSPEGQSFAVMLYASYRDCVCAGKCEN